MLDIQLYEEIAKEEICLLIEKVIEKFMGVPHSPNTA
jgi:hypothetical protein